MAEPARNYPPLKTYSDICSWPGKERWELIDGVLYDMTPTPPPRHQLILGELLVQFGNFLRGSPCIVFLGPFDVRLPKTGENGMTTTTVVQPDICVICEREKLDEQGCVGSPTLIIEILSLHTAKKDVREKRLLYAREGVREYWIVFPAEQMVHVLLLEDGQRYSEPVVYLSDDQLPVESLPGLTIDLTRVFKEF